MQQVNLVGQTAPDEAIYAEYAPVYAASGQAWVGLRALATTQAWLDRHGWRGLGGRAVDLGCGTGEVAVALALAEYQVAGIDVSAAMLGLAATHAAVNGAAVAWRQCDLRDWQPDGPLDLAVSFYDTLNYITEPADLAALFRQVGAALSPGGIFAFDLNTPIEYATWQERSTVTADSDGLFVYNILDRRESDGLACGRIIWFAREDDRWRRGEETHLQRGYGDDAVLAMLDGGGMALRARLAPDGAPADPASATRMIYIAQR